MAWKRRYRGDIGEMAWKRTRLEVHRTTRLSLNTPDEVHLPPQMYSCLGSGQGLGLGLG